MEQRRYVFVKKLIVCTVLTVVFGIFIIHLFITNGSILTKLGFQPEAVFLHFFSGIKNSLGRTCGDEFTFYSPVACLLYSLLSKCIPIVLQQGSVEDLRFSQQANIICMIFIIISFSLFVLPFILNLRRETVWRIWYFCIIPISYPMLSVILSGGFELLIISLITFFLLCKDSENTLVRELAILSLALASAMKVYPILFIGVSTNRKMLVKIISYLTGILLISSFFVRNELSFIISILKLWISYPLTIKILTVILPIAFCLNIWIKERETEKITVVIFSLCYIFGSQYSEAYIYVILITYFMACKHDLVLTDKVMTNIVLVLSGLVLIPYTGLIIPIRTILLMGLLLEVIYILYRILFNDKKEKHIKYMRKNYDFRFK